MIRTPGSKIRSARSQKISRRAESLLLLAGLLPLLTVARTDVFAASTSLTIYSPDRALRAVITPVGPESRESRVEIQKSDGESLFMRDYSSVEGEHGLTLTEDLWTPDSQFFVYSLSSSGGHQPYHSPTFFYSRRSLLVRNIEELTHRLVVNQAPDLEFRIVPPHSVALVTSGKGMDDQESVLVDLNTGGVVKQ